MKSRRFVIPDVHGCLQTLHKLIEDVIRLERMDTVYLLGDLIDRGPDSKGVIDYILTLREKGFRPVALRGNHEQMLIDACHDQNSYCTWKLNGGAATLESFDVNIPDKIPMKYRRFFESLPFYIELPEIILVHASINCAAEDPFSDHDAMLWRRSSPLDNSRLGGRKMISGHTPCSRSDIIESLSSEHITLDNGCVYTDRNGLGSLSVIELGTMKVSFLENCEHR